MKTVQVVLTLSVQVPDDVAADDLSVQLPADDVRFHNVCDGKEVSAVVLEYETTATFEPEEEYA